jgi:hypothetical protein
VNIKKKKLGSEPEDKKTEQDKMNTTPPTKLGGLSFDHEVVDLSFLTPTQYPGVPAFQMPPQVPQAKMIQYEHTYPCCLLPGLL